MTENKPQLEIYCGEGVYAIFDGYGIWLHANDLKNPTDKIYLEPSVLCSLNRFVNGFFNNNKERQDDKN